MTKTRAQQTWDAINKSGNSAQDTGTSTHSMTSKSPSPQPSAEATERCPLCDLVVGETHMCRGEYHLHKCEACRHNWKHRGNSSICNLPYSSTCPNCFRPAPSGETRGTPDEPKASIFNSECGMQYVNVSAAEKLPLGTCDMMHSPVSMFKIHRGLHQEWPACVNWKEAPIMPGHPYFVGKPLAPEAATKDLNPPLPTDCSHERLDEDGVCRKCGGDQRGQAGQFVAPTKERRCPKCLTKYHLIYLEICPLCVPIPSTTAANPPGVNSRSDADRRPKQGTPAAPGEAVGRETRELFERLPKTPTLRALEMYYAQKDGCPNGHHPNCGKICVDCVADELSTLRRERDQREEDFTKWKENRKSREDTLAKAINRIKPNEYIGGVIHECAIDLLAKLESQVRELTGAMKAQDEREAKAGELCGVSRELHGCDWPDAVAEKVAELRAAVEKLQGELKDARRLAKMTEEL